MIQDTPGVEPALLDELAAVDYGREAAHGDLTTPVAMRLGKMLRQAPRPLAERIADAIRKAGSAWGKRSIGWKSQALGS